ncbi:hypothetical protein DFJ74DRAFT_674689 [Hyaloraphidium curvatum]|nr:hypothetical protein DFJ74DRAFT_674689 [Hyaloraphidium curvatum]
MAARPKSSALVIGAGLGGLATAIALRRVGWTVTVLESAREIGEVGAGIQIPPNSSRILASWGLLDKLDAVACRPQATRGWRYADGAPLQLSPVDTEPNYGAPYFHIHRGDFHKVLLNEATAATLSAPANDAGPPVKLVTGASVRSVDCAAPSATTADGRTFKADLIVGADGIKSVVKPFVTGNPDAAKPSGDQAYRFLVKMEKVEADPELRFASEHGTNIWMGPFAHIVHYPISSYRYVNFVLVCPDDNTSEESWNAPGTLQELLQIYQDWDGRLKKLFALGERIHRWQLCQRPPLKTWVRGRTCLLGDACHAMVPYAAQGAAMAVEDAAALAEAVAALPLETALQVYQAVRIPRTETISSSANGNRTMFHMEDGPSQRQRDESLRKSHGQVSPAFHAAWSYDAVQEIRKAIGAEQKTRL